MLLLTVVLKHADLCDVCSTWQRVFHPPLVSKATALPITDNHLLFPSPTNLMLHHCIANNFVFHIIIDK
ncbi:hypothetical protein C0J52_05349 [Blattella germanica]|nr:hypothetical protein C0J52_05349 [Blattella germanica]